MFLHSETQRQAQEQTELEKAAERVARERNFLQVALPPRSSLAVFSLFLSPFLLHTPLSPPISGNADKGKEETRGGWQRAERAAAAGRSMAPHGQHARSPH